MPTVSVPQVNPNDEVTADSVNKGPNAIAEVVNGNLDSTNVSSLSGSKLNAGTVPASAMTTDANPETRMAESLADFVASGCVWSALTGLNAAMTAGVAYIAGKRLTGAAVTSKTFTASQDTYVYLDSTGTPQYVPVANGAAQPATTANTVLVAKVVTSASAVIGVTAMPSRQVTTNKIDLSAGITSGTNTGTAGGTLSFINIGGLKIAWGRTIVVTNAANTESVRTVVFPAGLFTAAPSFTASLDAATASVTGNQLIGNAVSASQGGLFWRNNTAAAGVGGTASWVAIGV